MNEEQLEKEIIKTLKQNICIVNKISDQLSDISKYLGADKNMKHRIEKATDGLSTVLERLLYSNLIDDLSEDDSEKTDESSQ